MAKTKKERGIYLSAEKCPRHGFAALMVMTLDEKDNGSGTRLVGPKSCCGNRTEQMRWRVTSDELREIAANLLDEVEEFEAFARRSAPSSGGAAE